MGLPSSEDWTLCHTGWLFLAMLACLLAVDYWLYRTKRPTFSTALEGWAYDWPLFPWLALFLMLVLWGHVYGDYFFGRRLR